MIQKKTDVAKRYVRNLLIFLISSQISMYFTGVIKNLLDYTCIEFNPTTIKLHNKHLTASYLRVSLSRKSRYYKLLQ